MSSRRERKRQPGDGPPQQTPADGGDESVASLVRRLGTPPPDIAAQLARRFRDACRQRLADGETIAAINLDDWTIGRHGDLVFTGQAPPADPGSRDLETLSAEFLKQLTAPRPAIAGRRRADRFRLRVNRNHNKSHNRFEQHAAEETHSLALSSIEHARREQLIEQFSASLASRFGEAAVAPPEVSEEKTRRYKPIPIVRDRRFNWNLVLGVGTAAVAIALIGAAIQINQIRLRRAETRVGQTATLERTATPTVGDPREPAETADPIEAITLPTAEPKAPQAFSFPPIDRNRDESNEAAPLDFTGPSVIERDRIRGGFDVMDDLDDLLASGIPDDPTDNPVPSVESSIETAESLEIEPPRGTTEDSRPDSTARSSSFVFAKDDAAHDTLESVLKSEISNQDAVEVPQQIRPSRDRFVELPPSDDRETETVIDQSAASIERLEFPHPFSIALSDPATDGTLDLINQQNGNRIAHLIRTGPATVFRWSDNAARDGQSQKLVHGRLVLSGGQSVYLRPSIETDPYSISLDPRRWRPSWLLGTPLLADVSRLEIDLSVPDSIDLAWHTPFDSARPHHGTAIAILTPTDGETVAIAVKLDIDCSRKLSCRMQFGGRLDPALPWIPLSRASFATEYASRTENLSKLVMQRGMFEQRYRSASQMDRTMMRTDGLRMDAAIERSEAVLERLDLLGELAVKIEQNAKLHLHALVQWPDATQTLLRTTSQAPEPEN